jgi:hypothetical protein
VPPTKKPDPVFNWWRLFHSLLRHGNSSEEQIRSANVWSWMNDYYVILKRIAAADDVQFDLLAALWKTAQETGTLPSYEILLEEVKSTEKNDELLDALKKDYRSQTDLTIHDPADLAVVLKDWCTDWEMRRITNVLKLTNGINLGSIEMNFMGQRNKKMSGPRDALKYLVHELEEGLLVDASNTLKPIVVQTEAHLGPEEYQQSLSIPQLECGFSDFYLERQDFIGILGYLGSGKSTVSRFMLYNMAAAGRNVLHISVENSQTVERDKFIFLHANNPKFGGKYEALTYAKKRKKQLTTDLLRMWIEVAQDFKETIEGRLTIRKPSVASWEHIKTLIETEDLVAPLDAVLLDYIQLLEPPSRNTDDQRSKMSAMIKDIRQFGMVFDGGRGMCIISPVQVNEEGLNRAAKEEQDGVYKPSAINNEKELGRSMTFIVGVFNKGQDPQGCYDVMFSCPKDRDGVGFDPFLAKMSPNGWVGGSRAKVSDIKPPSDYDPALATLESIK